MRMLIIKSDTDVQALSDQLFKAKLSGAQSEAALARLQTLNPHADLTKLRPGTVLLVPDAPTFKVSASNPVHGSAFNDFQKLVRDYLNQAATNMKAGNRARAEERDEVSAALKTSAVKRAADSDPELMSQVKEATTSFKQDQQQDKGAEQTVDNAGKAALAKLAELGKLLN